MWIDVFATHASEFLFDGIDGCIVDTDIRISMPFRLFFVRFCSFARRKMLKGMKREISRTFVEIVFFAAGWVTDVHVVVHDDDEEGGKGSGVRVRVRVRFRKRRDWGRVIMEKRKSQFSFPAETLTSLSQSFVGSISHAQPRTATYLENGKMRWRNLTLHFGQVTFKSLLSFSFLNNNIDNTSTTTTTNNNHLTMADALEEAGETGGGASLAKDLFSGAVGGIAQVLIGKM